MARYALGAAAGLGGGLLFGSARGVENEEAVDDLVFESLFSPATGAP